MDNKMLKTYIEMMIIKCEKRKNEKSTVLESFAGLVAQRMEMWQRAINTYKDILDKLEV
jgi:hypothetical protein